MQQEHPVEECHKAYDREGRLYSEDLLGSPLLKISGELKSPPRMLRKG
jgi:hypothetical protein